ncbi:MAG: hypothetical protein J0I12_29640 [Candidatus Eremiobacteraeota bacterium]|nr:hypothetical protein [Candidatus Eremiobacteraeota bacterium]
MTLMFVGAAFALAPSGFMRASQDWGTAAAVRAARSGLDWARLRISADPRWNAQTAATFQQGGLRVTEGDGQVTGWLEENGGWTRFRVRFNYQDGAASTAPESDGLDNPSTAWSDFPYVSCNNLLGPSSRPIPVAGTSSNASSAGPWTSTQITLPSHSLLLSVEGAYGRNVLMSRQVPVGFQGGFQKKVAQGVLKFGSSQPILEAVTMVNGDLDVKVNQPLALNSQPGQAARIRTKQSINLTGGATSTQGEILYKQGQTVSGTMTGVRVATDGNSGFLKIPADKVRQPASPITLSAGVYVVSGTTTPQINYVNMSYADYVASNPRPAGTPFTPPAGMSLSGPNTAPLPKFTLAVNRDVQVGQSGGVSDFALVPDGGADQSSTYGGVTPTPPAATATVNYATIADFYFDRSSGSNSAALTAAPQADILRLAEARLPRIAANVTPPAGASRAVSYNQYRLPSGEPLWVPTSIAGSSPIYLWMSSSGGQSGANQAFTTFLQSETHSPEFQALTATAAVDMNAALNARSGGSNSGNSANPNGLKPKDVELQLNGGASGISFANDGSITIGTQIKGVSSALVSKANIALIGTSTDLNSSPGTQLGLNLYAQGNITIDAFQLDSTGGQFRSFNLAGIVYAWNDVNVLMGNSSGGGSFSLKGGLVAYGGDPSTTAVAGQGKATLQAAAMSLTYDPSYMADLLSSGPFDLDIQSWHEF